MQRVAQRVADDNRRMRLLLAAKGVSEDEISTSCESDFLVSMPKTREAFIREIGSANLGEPQSLQGAVLQTAAIPA